MMNPLLSMLPFSILSTLCLLPSAQAFGQSMGARKLCVTKNDTNPRPAFPLKLELSNDVNEPTALLDVTSASSNFFRLREPLTMGKQGFGLTGEDIDFMGDVFGRLTLRFETPDDGTGVRPAFLRLTHSKRSFQRLFTEEQIPLLCLEL